MHYLRTLADTEQLKIAAANATTVVVIGAGWIGSEVTASMRTLGLPVTLLDVADVPLERVLGREVGTIYRDLHTDHGVTMRMNTSISSLQGNGRVEEIRTADGRVIPADLVVVGIGATPRTELATGAGLVVDNGALVDERLRTSNPNIYAAGDLANAWHRFYSQHIRVEHWANAQNQGLAVAASMLGDAAPYDRIPYFFSDQYDLGMEYCGHASTWDQVTFRGDPATREFIAFWLHHGHVVAAMNANVWDVTTPLQQLVRSRHPVDPTRLADTDTALESLVIDSNHS